MSKPSQIYSDNINLKSLINNNDYQDNTEYIRRCKNSQKLRRDTNHLKHLKSIHQGTQEELRQKANNECSHLFMHHTDLLNRMIKDELDFPMFEKILDALESIENGNETQDSASTNIGQMLADLYVNSALKQKQISDESNTPKTTTSVKNISWKEYKQSLRK
jgi:hypothetical protein